MSVHFHPRRLRLADNAQHLFICLMDDDMRRASAIQRIECGEQIELMATRPACFAAIFLDPVCAVEVGRSGRVEPSLDVGDSVIVGIN